MGCITDHLGIISDGTSKISPKLPASLVMIADDNLGRGQDVARQQSGERCTTRWGFYEICHKQAAAILQPDIRHCGGILELKKIANLAEIHEIAIAPHSAADPLGIVASVHAMAGTPNFLIQEFGGGTGAGLFKEPLHFVDGFVDLPQTKL